MSVPVRVYLSPGMFGFARLAAFEYFMHVVAAIERRYQARGQRVEIHIVEVHPTASIRRRAARLVEMVHKSAASDGGPIHLLGHSTGGLDARLVASPSAHLGGRVADQLAWMPRLRSVTTMNTPHYGTPLASFFATAKGQRLLYAVSAITVTALTLGSPPLAAASALIAALGRTGEALGVELALIDRIVEATVRVLDDASSRDLRGWLRKVRDDQGGVVQLMPEAMDLFLAGVEDRPGLRYQSVASYAPTSGVTQWIAHLRSPWAAVSATLFHLMQQIAGEEDDRYPCSPPDGGERLLRGALGTLPPPGASDGVVPLRSQLWGELVWVGLGDHLDVVGHFPGPHGHTDWLASGSRFDIVRFDGVMDRVVEGMMMAEDGAALARS
jgi:hypothetical protein